MNTFISLVIALIIFAITAGITCGISALFGIPIWASIIILLLISGSMATITD